MHGDTEVTRSSSEGPRGVPSLSTTAVSGTNCYVLVISGKMNEDSLQGFSETNDAVNGYYSELLHDERE